MPKTRQTNNRPRTRKFFRRWLKQKNAQQKKIDEKFDRPFHGQLVVIHSNPTRSSLRVFDGTNSFEVERDLNHAIPGNHLEIGDFVEIIDYGIGFKPIVQRVAKTPREKNIRNEVSQQEATGRKFRDKGHRQRSSNDS